MNRTSRLFLMGSGFVLAAGLGTGLVAFYGGLPTLASAGRSVGPDELKYVPEAAAVVAYANVRDVMNSEFRQKIRTVLPDDGDKGQEEFQRETGINIEQDIDYVLAWMTPNPEKGHPSGLVLLHGRFDPARLEALAATHGGVVETIDGIRCLRPNPESAPVPAEVEAVVPNVEDVGVSHDGGGFGDVLELFRADRPAGRGQGGEAATVVGDEAGPEPRGENETRAHEKKPRSPVHDRRLQRCPRTP